MADNNELDKTIEQLEAEVLAELEEANGPKAGAVPAEKDDKDNEADDLGGADGDEKDTDKDREIGKKAAGAAKKASDPKAKSSDASAKMEAKKVKEEDDDEEEDDEEEASKEMDESTSLKTKSQHLEYFGKMKASQVKEMLAAYQTSLAEADKDDEDEEDEEDMEEALKQETAVEKTVKDIDVGEDVDALMNGEDNLSEDFKNKAATIFEAAVKSKVRTEAHRIYEEIRAEKDSEMETIKEELTTQVDTYLNYVVEEWTKENELAIERGLKGEIAEDFIGGLKQLFEDHYIDVPDEKYDVLEAQSEKISELEDKLNEEIQKNVEVKETNSQMSREAVITESAKDLADTEVEKFRELTSEVEFTNEDSFREKIDTLKESYFPKTNPASSQDEEEETGLAQDIEISTSMEKYMTAIGNLK